MCPIPAVSSRVAASPRKATCVGSYPVNLFIEACEGEASHEIKWLALIQQISRKVTLRKQKGWCVMSTYFCRCKEMCQRRHLGGGRLQNRGLFCLPPPLAVCRTCISQKGLCLLRVFPFGCLGSKGNQRKPNPAISVT